MPSKFHHRNTRIREAIERRERRKADLDDPKEHDGDYTELSPDQPGDGHIVRKSIDEDEGSISLWDE